MEHFNLYDPVLMQQVIQDAGNQNGNLIENWNLNVYDTNAVAEWTKLNPQLPTNDFWNQK